LKFDDLKSYIIDRQVKIELSRTLLKKLSNFRIKNATSEEKFTAKLRRINGWPGPDAQPSSVWPTLSKLGEK